MKSTFATILAVLLALSVAACANTVRGVKRDIGSTAQAIEE
jgi:predicted small secreted protein